MPGRIGHGEAWPWESLCLETTVRLGGALILRERMDQSGASLRKLAEFGRSGPTACFGNGILLSPEFTRTIPDWAERLSALQGENLKLGVSALRQGGWSLKFVASQPIALRDGLRDIRAILAGQFQRLSVDFRKL